MIAVTKLETLRAVAAAVRRSEAWGEPWWEGTETEEALALGERLGWLVRLSTTQVHWTGAGAAAFAEFHLPAASRPGCVEDLAAHALECLLGRRGTLPRPPGAERATP